MMKKLMTNIGNLLVEFRHRTRVTPSLLGKTLTIYAYDKVFLVETKGLQVATEGGAVLISYPVTASNNRMTLSAIRLETGDLVSANNLMRKIYLAASPLHWRAFRFGVLAVLCATVISSFSEPAPMVPDLPVAVAPSYAPQAPVIPQVTAAADEMGLPPAPFID